MKANMIKWVAGACVATVVAFSGVVVAAEPVAPAPMDHAVTKPAKANHKAVKKHVVKKHAVKKHVVKKHAVKKHVVKKHQAVKAAAPAAK